METKKPTSGRVYLPPEPFHKEQLVFGRKLSSGDKAWFTMAGSIVAYDMWAISTGHCTMTQACKDSLAHPVQKWLVLAAWALTTKHLFLNDVAKWSDPFNVFAGGLILVRKAKGEKQC